MSQTFVANSTCKHMRAHSALAQERGIISRCLLELTGLRAVDTAQLQPGSATKRRSDSKPSTSDLIWRRAVQQKHRGAGTEALMKQQAEKKASSERNSPRTVPEGPHPVEGQRLQQVAVLALLRRIPPVSPFFWQPSEGWIGNWNCRVRGFLEKDLQGLGVFFGTSIHKCFCFMRTLCRAQEMTNKNSKHYSVPAPLSTG